MPFPHWKNILVMWRKSIKRVSLFFRKVNNHINISTSGVSLFFGIISVGIFLSVYRQDVNQTNRLEVRREVFNYKQQVSTSLDGLVDRGKEPGVRYQAILQIQMAVGQLSQLQDQLVRPVLRTVMSGIRTVLRRPVDGPLSWQEEQVRLSVLRTYFNLCSLGVQCNPDSVSVKGFDLSHIERLNTLPFGEYVTNASHSNLSHSNLSSLTLGSIDFGRSDLTHTKFNHSDLTGSEFDGTDAANANFSHTTLDNVSYRNAVLDSAEFYNSRGKGIDFTLAEARFSDFNPLEMRRPDMTSFHLGGASLREGVVFSPSNTLIKAFYGPTVSKVEVLNKLDELFVDKSFHRDMVQFIRREKE